MKKLIPLNEIYSVQDAEKSIKQILSSNTLFSMSSINKDNTPWINTAFYSFDENLNLYFLSDPNTIHTKNISDKKTVAVNIFDSHQKPEDEKKGLQLIGECHKINDEKEIFSAIKNYGKKYLSFGNLIKAVNDIAKNKMKARFYKIEINYISIFDEEFFGEETWVEVRVGQ